MKRPKWVTGISIGGLILFFCGTTGVCSSIGLEMAFVPPAIAPAISTDIPPSPSQTPFSPATVEPTITQTVEIASTPTIELTATVAVSDTPYPTETALPTFTPTLASVTGFELLSYSDTVSAGGTGYATIKTKPGASCRIDYYTPAGTHSTAQGLDPQTAGADGTCSWSWRIGARTNPGTGRIVITANGAQKEFPITIT